MNGPRGPGGGRRVAGIAPAAGGPLQRAGNIDVAIRCIVRVRHRAGRVRDPAPGMQPVAAQQMALRPAQDRVERRLVIERDGEQQANTLPLAVGDAVIAGVDDPPVRREEIGLERRPIPAVGLGQHRPRRGRLGGGGRGSLPDAAHIAMGEHGRPHDGHAQARQRHAQHGAPRRRTPTRGLRRKRAQIAKLFNAGGHALHDSLSPTGTSRRRLWDGQLRDTPRTVAICWRKPGFVAFRQAAPGVNGIAPIIASELGVS